MVFVQNFKNLKYIHPVCIKLYLGKKVVMMDLENSRRICLFVHVVMGHGKFENRIFRENEEKCSKYLGIAHYTRK